MSITINIAKEYTKTPGGRYIKEGPFSGEDFRNTILRKKFEESITTNKQLIVVLDGGYGYAPSFLEEAFGGLFRELKDKRIASIEIISEEEPKLIDDIKEYINKAMEVNDEKK